MDVEKIINITLGSVVVLFIIGFVSLIVFLHGMQ